MGADKFKDAVIHEEVERIMCPGLEVQLDNGHVMTAGIMWKILTGHVFDRGGDCCCVW